MRYLAIDYGDKRTGLAICDANETLACPITVIQGQGGLIRKILEVIEDERIDAIVVGLPYNMDDTEGPQAKKVRNFTAQLGEKTDLEIVFHDERLSSFEAEGKLAGLELTRKKKKKHLDAVAAAAILQSFLDHKHGK